MVLYQNVFALICAGLQLMVPLTESLVNQFDANIKPDVGHIEKVAQTDTSENEMITRGKRGTANALCNGFTKYPEQLALDGSVFKNIGHGMSEEQCQKACIDTTEFHCTAAIIRHPAVCFVTGYKLRDNYWSTHYFRLCASGPDCYKAVNGVSMFHSESAVIPWYYNFSKEVRSLFCMARCEQDPSCVSFDIIDKKANCYMHNLGFMEEPSYDLWLRRC